MPTKEIKALREEGRLEEAMTMAQTELNADPTNIWAKRNIGWVHYAYLKRYAENNAHDSFVHHLTEIKNLEMPAEEQMLIDKVAWQVGKMIFKLSAVIPADHIRPKQLWDIISSFSFSRPSIGYSFLFKSFHKALKETTSYVPFADWWGFENFQQEDFQKEKLPTGREVMATAEQAYITYAKHLLPKQSQYGDTQFDKEKAIAFLPKLASLAETYPQFQYPAYFQAKLLLAIGDKAHILDSLLPFVRKKRNDFWAWEILGDTVGDDRDKIFACYCKALSCKSTEEMMVGLRQKMVDILITKELFTEAKTEIEILTAVRAAHGFKIPTQVTHWQSQPWYGNTKSRESNNALYQQYIPDAESLLYSDTPEESVIVEFVNPDKKMLNFIASESKFGFFKYERFLKKLNIGDILKVRFQGGTQGGIHQVYTVIKTQDDDFKKKFLKEVNSIVKVPTGKPFGFLEDVFIHPSLLSKMKLTDGMHLKGLAMKSYNEDKKQWGWKLIMSPEKEN